MIHRNAHWSWFVPLPPLQLAWPGPKMEKCHCITRWQLRYMKSRPGAQPWDLSPCSGRNDKWCCWTQKQVGLSSSPAAWLWHMCSTPKSPSHTLCSPEMGHLLMGFLLETSQHRVCWRSFRDPGERMRRRVWDYGFQSSKQSCWEYLAQLSASSLLWRLLLDSIKIESWEVNMDMLSSLQGEISHSWELRLQISLLGQEERQERLWTPSCSKNRSLEVYLY